MLSKNFKLTFAVYDEAEVFTVEIDRTAWVCHLRRMIHLQRYKYQFEFFEIDLKFRLARKNGEWLQQDENLFELLRGPIDSEYEEMRTIWSLEEYLGSDFQPGVHEIHVLVEIPSERLPLLLKPIEVRAMKASMETFLNAVAYKLSKLYDFKCEDKGAPTIREALDAVENGHWHSKVKNGAVVTLTRMVAMFDIEEWRLLNYLSSSRYNEGVCCSYNRHIPKARGRRYIVLPDAWCCEEQVKKLKKFAVKAKVVARRRDLDVKSNWEFFQQARSRRAEIGNPPYEARTLSSFTDVTTVGDASPRANILTSQETEFVSNGSNTTSL